MSKNNEAIMKVIESLTAEERKAIFDAGKEPWSENIIHLGILLNADITEDKGEAILIKAAYRNSVKVAEWMMDAGASPVTKYDEALEVAASRGNVEFVNALLKDGKYLNLDSDVLVKPSRQDYEKIVDLLMKNGADPNGGWKEPVRAAARAGSIKVMRLYIKSGVEMDNTILEAAIEGRNEEVIELVGKTMFGNK